MSKNHKDTQSIDTKRPMMSVRAEWSRPELRKFNAREAEASIHTTTDGPAQS